jgi:hypothetical protein
MQSILERFDATSIQWIDEIIAADPDLTRSLLSKLVCEQLDWRAPNGHYQTTACAIGLRRLHELNILQLPAPRWTQLNNREPAPRLEPYERPPLACSLAELGEIRLVMVNGDRGKLTLWRRMLDRHPLGAGALCGAQIRYLVESAGGGLLGGLAFSSAAWRLAARDRWIGWSDETRSENLPLVVNNSRFLILPQVAVPNLASKVLGLACRQLVRDWEIMYAVKPVLLETFVDPAAYRGTCYRAANWLQVGRTTGRGRQDDGDLTRPKDIYLLPLRTDFRKVLGGHEPRPPEDWSEVEFGRTDFGDKRLRDRLLRLARDFSANPQAGIPEACQTKAAVKAAYRFFQHPAVNMKNILQGHYAATTDRIRRHHGVVLAVQDTTTLNYHTHAATDGLGPIDAKGTRGLLVHDTMAFTADGIPLGLVDVQYWARKEKKGKNPVSESEKWLKSFEAAAKVNETCSRQLMVSVGDREADFYELFTRVKSDGPQLLVRAMHHRKLVDADTTVWLHLARSPLAGRIEVQIPSRGGRQARVAKLEVRFDRIVLQPPVNRRDLQPVQLWAVLANEKNPPPNVNPLEWLLLTTVSVESFEDACERISWYTKRWGIEIFHRTLKNGGCNIEDRQLGTGERLAACLALDMVVAWRIYYMTKIGKEAPDLPCTTFLTEDEWRALVAYSTGNQTPEAPPTTREATLMIARLGGYQDRKGKSPGNTTICRGVAPLSWITMAWRMYINGHGPP